VVHGFEHTYFILSLKVWSIIGNKVEQNSIESKYPVVRALFKPKGIIVDNPLIYLYTSSDRKRLQE